MRISDWSSDVCSSDLVASRHRAARRGRAGRYGGGGALPFGLRRRGTDRGRPPGAARGGGAEPAAPPPGQCRASLARRATLLPSGRDRKSVVSGKSVPVRLDLGGRRIIKKKKTK